MTAPSPPFPPRFAFYAAWYPSLLYSTSTLPQSQATDVFKAALHRDPRLRLPLDSLTELLRDQRLWSMGSTPAFGSLAAGLSETKERVRGILQRDHPVDGNFAADAWFEAVDFVPWWTGLEPVLVKLHTLSATVRRQN